MKLKINGARFLDLIILLTKKKKKKAPSSVSPHFTPKDQRGQIALLETLIESFSSLKEPRVLYKDYKERFYLFINSQMEQGQRGGTVSTGAEVNSQRHWPWFMMAAYVQFST